jgi:hypothetical protein
VRPCVRFEVLAAGTVELVFWEYFLNTYHRNVIPEGLINLKKQREKHKDRY